jgi:hypothetical protein
MKGMTPFLMGAWLFAQACSLSNAPTFPGYSLELDVTDPLVSAGNGRIEGLLERGTIEAVTTVGSCHLQLQLGQCKEGEEVWLNFRALENDPSRPRKCSPSVWERVKSRAGQSLALASDPELTRTGEGVFLEVLAGEMQDLDGNGVVDKRSNENRIAASPFTVGRLDIYEATDRVDGATDLSGLRGELVADLEARDPSLGFVRGQIDAAVDAVDGSPVGPRCHWQYFAEEN